MKSKRKPQVVWMVKAGKHLQWWICRGTRRECIRLLLREYNNRRPCEVPWTWQQLKTYRPGEFDVVRVELRELT